MKVLVVGLKKNPQLKRLIEEGEKLGVEVKGCLASELVITASGSNFSYKVGNLEINDFDLIYLMVSKSRWDWYLLVKHLVSKNKKLKIINQKVIDPSYNLFLTPFSDYLAQFENKLPFPKSKLILSRKELIDIEKDFKFPLIVKKPAGRQGKGVCLVRCPNDLTKTVISLLKETNSLVIREYIPNKGDIRVFTVGYRAISAMKRIPPEGEFRSNISIGGKGESFDLDKNNEIKDIAERVSRITRTEIAGVDIIIDKNTNKSYILEVNPSPQFLGIEKYAKDNIAAEIIKYFITVSRLDN